MRSWEALKTFASYCQSQKTSIPVITHLEPWPAGYRLLHQVLHHPLGQGAKLCVRTFPEMPSPLLWVPPSPGQSSGRWRGWWLILDHPLFMTSKYPGSPRSRQSILLCNFEETPCFRTEESMLRLNSPKRSMVKQKRNVPPSPPPGDPAGLAGKHSLPAYDREMHYVTRGRTSKSYF